jgi:hypothetical protein
MSRLIYYSLALAFFGVIGVAAPYWALGMEAVRLPEHIDRFWVDRHNAGPYTFALWCVVVTAAWGAILGFLMDRLMSLTGLDLTSRTKIER